MCGICGLYAPDLGERAEIVAAMNAALSHRGPDDSGQFTDGSCSIAMRRLAIIDLTTGHQPMSNETGGLSIVFNGEIYNFQELRTALAKSGKHTFSTSSDTEVILHLFEDHGTDTPNYLKGMFAFCIYNRATGELFLARDRFGEKPLYYAQVDGALAFSSELGSLVNWQRLERRVNLAALHYYLRFGFVPAPMTMYAGIQQLPPGHWMIWRDGQLHIECYYTHQAPARPTLVDEASAVEAIREALLRAVKRQMVSDVPLGAFLSGGIDSSTIVAAMQRQSEQPVKTFTVRFEYAAYDESPIARDVARFLGTDHHEFVITNAGFDEADLWRIVRHVGQPFSDSSAIPTYFISREIRDHVTVCLSGDGGDELFAGYHYFLWSLQVDRLSRLAPKSVLGAASAGLEALSRLPWLNRLGRLRQMRQAANLASLPASARIPELGSLFEADDLARLLVKPLPALEDDFQRSWYEDQPSRLRELMAYRVGFLLPEDMLVKVDRMSMAASLETRAPMLDADLAALSLQLPDHLLINRGVTKYALRQAARDWLPDSVFSHPKTGFSIPLHMFQNDRYEQMCREFLLEGQNDLIGQLFSRQAMERLVRRGLTRKTDAADASVYRTTHQLWAMLQLAAWATMFQVRI